MSAVQNEEGFIQIANRLFEAIMQGGFTQRELLVLLAILRKTLGYNKLVDDMSASQIGALCNITRAHVTTTLNGLEARNVITKRPGKFGMLIGIQMDVSKWISSKFLKSPASTESVQVGSTESVLVPNQYMYQIGTSTSTESVQVDSTESVHTKDNLPKDNLKIQSTPIPPSGGLVRPKTKRETVVLQTFLDACKANGERPMANYEPLWRYTDGVGLPTDFVSLAWVEFCRQFRPGGTGDARRYKDWRKAFRNYVEKNYLKLWAIDGNDQYFLTTLGKQAQKHFESREVA